MSQPVRGRQPGGPVRTAAIVGLHWGLVYLPTLRDLGVDVVALVSRTSSQVAAVAHNWGVPLGTTELGRIEDVDLAVVATPARTHAEVISALPSPYLICEKPLIGAEGSAHDLPSWSDSLLVNYAFAHLETARAAERAVPRLGVVTDVRLRSTVHLPQEFSAEEWFLETASHPLAWLLFLFGRPDVVRRRLGRDTVQLEASCGDSVRLSVDFAVAGPLGIHHEVEIAGSAGTLRFTGSYVPPGAWRFTPVVLEEPAASGSRVPGRQELTRGEYSRTDCWLDANRRAITDMVAVFRGELSWQGGLQRGLSDRDRALWLESLLQQPAP